MNQVNLNAKPVNNLLTMAIIKFHEQGYTEDFFVKDEDTLYAQSSPELIYTDYMKCNIIQFYDRLTCGYKCMYTVETFCGIKGLLLT